MTVLRLESREGLRKPVAKGSSRFSGPRTATAFDEHDRLSVRAFIGTLLVASLALWSVCAFLVLVGWWMVA